MLMDLTTPRMNGAAATRPPKTRWRPVGIVLPVHDDPLYERTVRAAGADRFLLKGPERRCVAALGHLVSEMHRDSKGTTCPPDGGLRRGKAPPPAESHPAESQDRYVLDALWKGCGATFSRRKRAAASIGPGVGVAVVKALGTGGPTPAKRLTRESAKFCRSWWKGKPRRKSPRS
jgi:hypothetical protein